MKNNDNKSFYIDSPVDFDSNTNKSNDELTSCFIQKMKLKRRNTRTRNTRRT
jgi:hypothetical protein